MMKLYGLGPTRSLRALWALQELDAEFEFVPVNLLAGENRRPDFLRLNPTGKLPVLVDGDLVLTESAAIVMYLAERSEEHTSELQSLMRISYAVFCLKKKK